MSALPICIYCQKSFATQRDLDLLEEREQYTLKFSKNFLQGNQNDQIPDESNLPSDTEVADPIGAGNIDSPMAIDLLIVEETSDVFTVKLKDQSNYLCSFTYTV